MTDFARLAVQDFLRDVELDAASIDGYTADLPEADAWPHCRTDIHNFVL